MHIKSDEGKAIDFHGTTMVIKAATGTADLNNAVIWMEHPPMVGPALHYHPDGPETFYVLEGSYNFLLGSKEVAALPGDLIIVPANVPHRYRSGPAGGKVLVTSPPDVARYFVEMSARLEAGPVSQVEEFAFASAHGQVFLDGSGHWAPME